jgi:hypothetical protein
VQKWFQRSTACEGVLTSKQIIVHDHPPYSTDLAPSDFILFPTMKVFKGRYFDDTDDIGVIRRQL